MAKELYVGNIAEGVTEDDLRRHFSVSGRVTSIHLITDPVSGKFKGCGYVRMATDEETKDAIESLDGALLMNKQIRVSEARPQKERPAKPEGGRRKTQGGFGKPRPAKSSPKGRK